MSTKHTKSLFVQYTVGFVLSIILTLVAFGLVIFSLLGGYLLIGVLLGLAVVQMYVQLRFFLHLSQESHPRWNTLSFMFMGLIVLTIVIGSMWIMQNLNYNMIPSEMDAYMRKQVDKGF